MRKLLMFGILALLASTGVQAQEKPKPLQFSIGNYKLQPVVRPLSEQIPPIERTHTLFDSDLRRRYSVFIGAQWRESGAEFEAGVRLGYNPDKTHRAPPVHFQINY